MQFLLDSLFTDSSITVFKLILATQRTKILVFVLPTPPVSPTCDRAVRIFFLLPEIRGSIEAAGQLINFGIPFLYSNHATNADGRSSLNIAPARARPAAVWHLTYPNIHFCRLSLITFASTGARVSPVASWKSGIHAPKSRQRASQWCRESRHPPLPPALVFGRPRH